MSTLTIRRPDDWHLHLRDGAALAAVLPFTAARFLSRFVPEAVSWAHVDLAAATRSGGLAHVNTDVTGFGVRFALELLLRRKAAQARP